MLALVEAEAIEGQPRASDQIGSSHRRAGVSAAGRFSSDVVPSGCSRSLRSRRGRYARLAVFGEPGVARLEGVLP